MVFPLRTNTPGYPVPFVTLVLLLLNCAVYAVELIWPGGIKTFISLWGEVPTRIWSGEPVPGTHISAWVTAITAMFTHFGLMHLVGNMMALWLFGASLE